MTLVLVKVRQVAGLPAVVGPLDADVRGEWGAIITRSPRAIGGAERVFLDRDRSPESALMLLPPSGLERGQVIEWGGKRREKREMVEAQRRYWTIVDVSGEALLVDEWKKMDTESPWPARFDEHGPEQVAAALAITIGFFALFGVTAAGVEFSTRALRTALDYLVAAKATSDVASAKLRAERARLVARIAEIDALLGGAS